MTARPKLRLLAAAALLALGPGCSGDEGGPAAPSTTTAPATAAAPAPGPNRVAVDMSEYAFDIEGSLAGGTGTVALRNTGAEVHMAAFGRLEEGRTVEDVVEALAAEDASAFDRLFAEQLDAPGGLLGPGEAMEVTTPFLAPGTYAVMCFVPTVGEEAPHSAKGMVAGMEVAEGDVRPPAPEVDAVYSIGGGRTDGPVTLPAGRTTLEVRSGAGGPHEVIVARKRSAATTYQEIDAAYTSLFEGEVPPAPGYAEGLPAAIAGNVFDVAEGASVLVTLDLSPGDYLVGCARQPEDGPEHTGELVEVRVG